ncbi:CobW family GTP-binding protein [Ketobacter alkanivorans]|uniref:Cobalamin biosynthesis protein CobW n=1 Tax=Ketobacter alkanivorans TaxID=1917421 RepID=A0A2K9LRK0_9GAMM|nr:GTP-binding protein [Ketobacter alkanivorans]AUM14948.1 cobalamin biosynthesis protein CobW [Ketobacter alkanivorans]
MNYNTQFLQAIPTNIISGFLGVGKTSAILSLLRAKPKGERWAVLVNEFGEIGIDGGLFQGQYPESTGVFIREVPGGCMCCTAGLPMQVALNQLLARAKPQRLLIEPSGLGHPREVLSVLNAVQYRGVLDIQNNVTLVDARKLTDSRYTSHDTFNQQIDIADIIVGNKQDLYQGNEKALLENYIATRKGRSTRIIFTDHGNLDSAVLTGSLSVARALTQPTLHHHKQDSSINDLPIPACGYLKIENTGEGYQSAGWRFATEKVFNRNALLRCFNGLYSERMKAVLKTDEGTYGYNFVDGALTESKLADCLESRIEIISSQIEDTWESHLLDCLKSNDEPVGLSAKLEADIN